MSEHDAIDGDHNEHSSDANGGAAPPTREYSRAEITVQWNAERCIHSAKCIRALPRVFDPRKRPWIDVSVANADELSQAVLQCPSGALHFVRTDGGLAEIADEPTTITPVRNGPLYVRGKIEIRNETGAVMRTDTRATLCRCGLTKNFPLCDTTCHQTEWREPTAGSQLG